MTEPYNYRLLAGKDHGELTLHSQQSNMESSSNTFEIVDIGANLTSNKFSDIPKIISNALAQNVSIIIVTGKIAFGYNLVF